MKTTVLEDELEKFSSISKEWWDENGKFSTLHSITPLRVKYIKDNILKYFSNISGLNFLDIGCGGGLLAEPMARLGARVTAIDAAQASIDIASSHAKVSGLNINYICTTVEELAQTNTKYDVITCLEVLEHVDNLEYFVKCATQLLNKNGLIIFSTLNRSIKSYLFSIVGAEYILRWLPIGTHNWNKFIKPSELYKLLSDNNINITDMSGMEYTPLKGQKWALSSDLSINYFITGQSSK